MAIVYAKLTGSTDVIVVGGGDSASLQIYLGPLPVTLPSFPPSRLPATRLTSYLSNNPKTCIIIMSLLLREMFTQPLLYTLVFRSSLYYVWRYSMHSAHFPPATHLSSSYTSFFQLHIFFPATHLFSSYTSLLRFYINRQCVDDCIRMYFSYHTLAYTALCSLSIMAAATTTCGVKG